MGKINLWLQGQFSRNGGETVRPRCRVRAHAALICLMACAVFPSVSRAQGPVFEITPVESSVQFEVDSSVAIKGTFNKWAATLVFTSPELSSGVLEIKIQADSVDTGSGMKNGKLKSKDFFNAEQDPYITFKSTKIVQTGPDTFEVDGDFTIRGVTKQEKLALVVTGRGNRLRHDQGENGL